MKWKLVPVEPTPEMIKAGADVECIITGIDEIDAPEDYKRVFMAMLEAAPQPPKSEPIAYIEHHKGGDNLVWDNPGGKYSALYTAPPAPSVPDEELQAAFDRGLKAGNGQKEAQQVEIHRLHDLLAAAPQPPRLSDDRIREIWVEHGLDDEDVEGFARAIEREILGGDEK
jgi:hypothetical protein